MDLTMNQFTKIVFVFFLGAITAPTFAATLFNRSDFGPNAVEYGFNNASLGDVNVGEGNLNVSNGIVADTTNLGATFFDNQGFTGPTAYVGRTPNFSFIDPVRAFGLNFAVPQGLFVQLNIQDTSGLFLDRIILDTSSLAACDAISFFKCGFIGIDAGSNQIGSASFARFTGPPANTIPSGDDPIIDNIIYQQTPTPGILWLICLGLPGLLFTRKKHLASS